MLRKKRYIFNIDDERIERIDKTKVRNIRPQFYHHTNYIIDNLTDKELKKIVKKIYHEGNLLRKVEHIVNNKNIELTYIYLTDYYNQLQFKNLINKEFKA